MNNALHKVVYCSRNLLTGSLDVTREEIELILRSSRRNNAGHGVTGALLFNRGCFAQVLEGSRDNVEWVFEKIACDPRHGSVTLLEVGALETRGFPDWSMGYAGMLEDDRATFAALTLTPSEGADTVLSMLHAIMLHEEGISHQ